jgi:hypothetical protein
LTSGPIEPIRWQRIGPARWRRCGRTDVVPQGSEPCESTFTPGECLPVRDDVLVARLGPPSERRRLRGQDRAAALGVDLAGEARREVGTPVAPGQRIVFVP